jgi:hypothetical protein
MDQRPGPAARLINQIISWVENITEPFFSWLESGRAVRRQPGTRNTRVEAENLNVHRENLERIRSRIDSDISQNPANTQSIFGLLRVILFIGILIMFSLLGGYLFENVDATALARNLKDTNFFFRRFPLWLLKFGAFILHPNNLRYMILPLAAMLSVFIGGGYFVSDVYLLKNARKGLHYVISSLFAVRMPTLTVDGGKKVLKPGDVNLLDAIGGPGYLLIQPGNAVLFRTLRQPSNTSITSSYFMSPFETIGQITNLDDQHDFVDEVRTTTRDGIPLMLRDVHFRFRILPEVRDGRPILRSLANPFPFSQAAMQSMIVNLTVTSDGQDPWRVAVRRSVIGAITDYVSSHDLDFLTAPRLEGMDPRQSIHDELSAHNKRALRNLGAELIWVDIGHPDILAEEVDFKRADYWAAEWDNNAKLVRAEGEAKRLAYGELGRAEAQAEIIKGIVRALEEAAPATGEKVQLRTLMLVRTAQILDAIRKEEDNLQ